MNMMNLLQMLTQIKNNPASILNQFGVPQNMMNNPKDVIQHLMNQGHITQGQYDEAVRQAQKLGYKF